MIRCLPGALLAACALTLTAAGPAVAKPSGETPARPPTKASKTQNASKTARQPASARKARTAAAAPAGLPYAGRDEATALADSIAREHGLDAAWTRAMLAQARQLPTVARLVLPPPAGTPKNWAAYRARFVEPIRIQAGVRFWQAHEATLARAEAEYGVPAEIIVGIIGVESIYGRQMGSFRVLDALATLGLDFPAAHPRAAERSAFFRSELGHFLALQARQGGDPTQPLGSYAGAMGMPQFMPSSWARWAVDYDGDGRIDLWRAPADVIGSVASYFKAFGWKPGMPTHYPIAFDTARVRLDALLAPDILPTFSAAALQEHGVLLDDAAARHAGPMALVELQNGDAAPSYVAGTENFYVVTRYNWSSYYAMAVIDLGRAVRQALEGTR